MTATEMRDFQENTKIKEVDKIISEIEAAIIEDPRINSYTIYFRLSKSQTEIFEKKGYTIEVREQDVRDSFRIIITW